MATNYVLRQVAATLRSAPWKRGLGGNHQRGILDTVSARSLTVRVASSQHRDSPLTYASDGTSSVQPSHIMPAMGAGLRRSGLSLQSALPVLSLSTSTHRAQIRSLHASAAVSVGRRNHDMLTAVLPPLELPPEVDELQKLYENPVDAKRSDFARIIEVLAKDPRHSVRKQAMWAADLMMGSGHQLDLPIYHLLLRASRHVEGKALEIIAEIQEDPSLKLDIATINAAIASSYWGMQADQARHIWEEVLPASGLDPNAETYHLLINGLCKEGKFREALELYVDTESLDLGTDQERMLTSLTEAAKTDEQWRLVVQLAEKAGIELKHADTPPAIRQMVKDRKYTAVYKALQEGAREGLYEPRVYSWVMAEAATHPYDCGDIVTNVYKLMMEHNMPIRAITVGALVTYYSGIKNKSMVRKYVAEMRERGMLDNTKSYGTAIKSLGRVGDTELATQLWEECRADPKLKPEPPLYTVLLRAYAISGSKQDKALGRALFQEMKDKKLPTTASTYTLRFQLAEKDEPLEDIIDLYKEFLESDQLPDSNIYVALFKACALWHDLNTAFKLYDDMINFGVTLNRRTWNSLLLVCATVGDLENARAVVQGMGDAGLTPTYATYSHLITACTNAGSDPVIIHDFWQEMENKLDRSDIPIWLYQKYLDASISTGEWSDVMMAFNVMPTKRKWRTQEVYCKMLDTGRKARAPAEDLSHVIESMIADGHVVGPLIGPKLSDVARHINEPKLTARMMSALRGTHKNKAVTNVMIALRKLYSEQLLKGEDDPELAMQAWKDLPHADSDEVITTAENLMQNMVVSDKKPTSQSVVDFVDYIVAQGYLQTPTLTMTTTLMQLFAHEDDPDRAVAHGMEHLDLVEAANRPPRETRVFMTTIAFCSSLLTQRAPITPEQLAYAKRLVTLRTPPPAPDCARYLSILARRYTEAHADMTPEEKASLINEAQEMISLIPDHSPMSMSIPSLAAHFQGNLTDIPDLQAYFRSINHNRQVDYISKAWIAMKTWDLLELRTNLKALLMTNPTPKQMVGLNVILRSVVRTHSSMFLKEMLNIVHDLGDDRMIRMLAGHMMIDAISQGRVEEAEAIWQRLETPSAVNLSPGKYHDLYLEKLGAVQNEENLRRLREVYDNHVESQGSCDAAAIKMVSRGLARAGQYREAIDFLMQQGDKYPEFTPDRVYFRHVLGSMCRGPVIPRPQELQAILTACKIPEQETANWTMIDLEYFFNACARIYSDESTSAQDKEATVALVNTLSPLVRGFGNNLQKALKVFGDKVVQPAPRSGRKAAVVNNEV
eukprot:TRINITY_DN40612_c0_g1_i1.p1 TRINITY_DN40612_c0_g1~~TRINITY_DN40612_c0_g1_i1.p1  ORF type:complete len:1294 (+),score=282.93 TRINITY_DN40612_c0_g1_i1:286-4167(+)